MKMRRMRAAIHRSLKGISFRVRNLEFMPAVRAHPQAAC